MVERAVPSATASWRSGGSWSPSAQMPVSMAWRRRAVIALALLAGTSPSDSGSDVPASPSVSLRLCCMNYWLRIGRNWKELVCNRFPISLIMRPITGPPSSDSASPERGQASERPAMAVPSGVKYAVIGAGIHGLSTAYHLALELKARSKGSGKDILVLDKTAIAAGASGIACGVVRNNYFQPAMRELMAHSVEVWESDPKAYSYHPVGYMQISPECMRGDVASIYEQQKAIGYESVFIDGAEASAKYMRGLFDDWQAQNITSVLHEKRGGYANNKASMHGL